MVPFAPGGTSEIVARASAAELTKSLGQSVYVDNKPGGAGNVAMGEVARADPPPVNPYIVDKLPYDKVPSLCVVHPDERLSADAPIPVGSNSAAFAAFIVAEQKRWKPVIGRAKIKPD